MKKLAVIVPCYNEELVIAESYRRTREALQKLPVLTEIYLFAFKFSTKIAIFQ